MNLTSACLSIFVRLCVRQIRRHGTKDDHGEDLWLRVLAERRAGHRPARPRHRVQLQQDLPPEPEGREETSTEGDELRFTSSQTSSKDTAGI